MFLAFVWAGVFYRGSLGWFYEVFGVFGYVLLFILCIFPMVYARFVNYVLSKNKSFWIHLFFPAIAWVAIEYLRSEWGPLKFSWLGLGYSQHANLPVLQLAGIFGVYGLSFLIVLTNTILVYLFLHRKESQQIKKVSVFLILLFIFILIYGQFKLSEKFDENIKVALVQGNLSSFVEQQGESGRVSSKVDFILLPENSVKENWWGYFTDDSSDIQKAKEIAEVNSSYIVVCGIYRNEDNQQYQNTAFIFDSSGETVGTYVKHNPVPFFFDGAAGEELSVFETKHGKIATPICYDMDFPYVSRNLVKKGAEILFNPTQDLDYWKVERAPMTTLRAVENFRYIVRPTISGVSQIIDPCGRITLQIDTEDPAIEYGKVEFLKKRTLYNLFGFLLPILCVFLTLFFILRTFWKIRFS